MHDIRTRYYTLGPSPVESDEWVIYHPFSLSFVNVPHDLGEKLFEIEISRKAEKYNNDQDVKHFLEEIKKLKPSSIAKIPHKPEIAYINVTSLCNLRCKYCYVHFGDYNVLNPIKEIKEELIPKISDFLSNLGIKEVVFFGGEPLIGINSIRKIIKNLDKRINVKYSLVTNGTLINHNIINLIKEYNIKVTVSLDGWRIVHDLNRTYANGRESYNDVVHGISQLIRHEIPIFVQATYHSSHADIGVTPMQIASYLSRITNYFVIKPSLPLNEIVAHLYGVYMVESLRELSRPEARYVDQDIMILTILLINRIFKPFSCEFYGYLTILPNGDIYTCNVFPPFGKLGNINDKPETIINNYRKLISALLPELVSTELHEFLGSNCYTYRKYAKKYDKIFNLYYKILLIEFYKILREGKEHTIVHNIEAVRMKRK